MTRAVLPFARRIHEQHNSQIDFKTFRRYSRKAVLRSLIRRAETPPKLSQNRSGNGTVQNGRGIETGVCSWLSNNAPLTPVPHSTIRNFLLNNRSQTVGNWSRAIGSSELDLAKASSITSRVAVRGVHRWLYGVNRDDGFGVENWGGVDHFYDPLSLKKAEVFTNSAFAVLETDRAIALAPKGSWFANPPLLVNRSGQGGGYPKVEKYRDPSFLYPTAGTNPSRWERKILKRRSDRASVWGLKRGRRGGLRAKVEDDRNGVALYNRMAPSPYNSSWDRWADWSIRHLFKPVETTGLRGRRQKFLRRSIRPVVVLGDGSYPMLRRRALLRVLRVRQRNAVRGGLVVDPLYPKVLKRFIRRRKDVGRYSRIILPKFYQLDPSLAQIRAGVAGGRSIGGGSIKLPLSPSQLLLPKFTIPNFAFSPTFKDLSKTPLTPRCNSFLTSLIPNSPRNFRSAYPIWLGGKMRGIGVIMEYKRSLRKYLYTQLLRKKIGLSNALRPFGGRRVFPLFKNTRLWDYRAQIRRVLKRVKRRRSNRVKRVRRGGSTVLKSGTKALGIGGGGKGRWWDRRGVGKIRLLGTTEKQKV